MSERLEQELQSLDLAGLVTVQAKIAELVESRRAEVLQRLEAEAASIGASIHVNGVARRKPRRRQQD